MRGKRDLDVACTFQAKMCGKSASLIGLRDYDMDINTVITTYNTAVTEAASEIRGTEHCRRKSWVTKDVLDLCDEKRDLRRQKEQTYTRKQENSEANEES